MSIETVPAGATVVLDDKPLGATPLSIPSLPAGTHRLRLTAANYFDWDGEVEVPPGAPLAQRILLPPKPGEIEVKSLVSGARIWLDGADVGPAPVGAMVEAGERTIRVEAEGYDGWEVRLALQPNERRALYVVPSGPSLNLVHEDPSAGVAVTIDNQKDARPQTGLNAADVVYEALVEGGITRYLALFLTRPADVIGPVRSARHYFVNWAAEYRAPLMHIGASPQGYGALAATRLPHVDSRAFYRTRRPAPHNAYTSTAAVQSELRTRDASSFGGLRFGNPEPTDLAATGLRLSYGARDYNVGWAYDTGKGVYERSINGEVVVDADSGEPITATNILVLWMDSWPLEDDEAGRLDFRQTGGGQLLALRHGFATDGRWLRGSLRNVTEYRDQQGQPLLLTPGNTWIQVIPSGTRVDLFGGDDHAGGGTS
ncbi:MAG: DUF3048 domain-containing protein [Chloroflexi bacterium]|nr:DUF3048 domain-containing protein [Chloroflexota bacterium]